MQVDIDHTSYHILDFVTQCIGGFPVRQVMPVRIILSDPGAQPFGIWFEFKLPTPVDPQAHREWVSWGSRISKFNSFALGLGVDAGAAAEPDNEDDILGSRVEFRGEFRDFRQMVEVLVGFSANFAGPLGSGILGILGIPDPKDLVKP